MACVPSLRALIPVLLAGCLAACGGGGSGSPNAAPAANAGPAQSLLVGTPIALDGSASADSDGDALSYSWPSHKDPWAATRR